MNNTRSAQIEILDILNNTHFQTELPNWLAEGVCKYLSLSAKEEEDRLLVAKAHFAVQKRSWTAANLSSIMVNDKQNDKARKFIAGVVDFLQRGVEEDNLYYGLSRRWKKFIVSGGIAESNKWPVDYLIKKAFIQS